VSEQVRRGKIDKTEARAHLLKNVITRSCGVAKNLEVDITTEAIKEGDTILLCTDGLINFVSDAEIWERIGDNSAEWVLPELIHLALSRGGDDNITAVLISLGA
jgi:protein phosphatase